MQREGVSGHSWTLASSVLLYYNGHVNFLINMSYQFYLDYLGLCLKESFSYLQTYVCISSSKSQRRCGANRCTYSLLLGMQTDRGNGISILKSQKLKLKGSNVGTCVEKDKGIKIIKLINRLYSMRLER